MQCCPARDAVRGSAGLTWRQADSESGNEILQNTLSCRQGRGAEGKGDGPERRPSCTSLHHAAAASRASRSPQAPFGQCRTRAGGHAALSGTSLTSPRPARTFPHSPCFDCAYGGTLTCYVGLGAAHGRPQGGFDHACRAEDLCTFAEGVLHPLYVGGSSREASKVSPTFRIDLAVFDALRHLSSYLFEAHTAGRHHLADLYELVQYAGNIVPRCVSSSEPRPSHPDGRTGSS